MGDLQDPEKFKSRMHSLAYGQAMAAACQGLPEGPLLMPISALLSISPLQPRT